MVREDLRGPLCGHDLPSCHGGVAQMGSRSPRHHQVERAVEVPRGRREAVSRCDLRGPRAMPLEEGLLGGLHGLVAWDRDDQGAVDGIDYGLRETQG